jgi:hypothetical protein
MKPYLPTFAIASALIAVGLAPGEFVSSAHAQHSQLQGPADMRPEFDNATMLVLRIRMAPHEKTAMHELSARLVIWLTDAHLRDTKPDGTVTDYRRAAGSTEWVPAQRHAGENLSDTPIEFLAVVPKPGGGAGEPHAPH